MSFMCFSIIRAYGALYSPWGRQGGIVQEGDGPVAGYRDVILFGDD